MISGLEKIGQCDHVVRNTAERTSQRSRGRDFSKRKITCAPKPAFEDVLTDSKRLVALECRGIYEHDVGDSFFRKLLRISQPHLVRFLVVENTSIHMINVKTEKFVGLPFDWFLKTLRSDPVIDNKTHRGFGKCANILVMNIIYNPAPVFEPFSLVIDKVIRPEFRVIIQISTVCTGVSQRIFNFRWNSEDII